MAIFDGLRRMASALTAGTAQKVIRSPWSDSSHLADVVFNDIFGIDVQGPVTRAAAIRVATVAKGRDVLTGMISGQPLMSTRAGQPVVKLPRLLAQPEDGIPLSTTLIWTVDALFFYGRAWWRITEFDATGYPSRVERVDEDDVTFDEAGRVSHANGRAVAPNSMIRFDGPNEGLLCRGADTIRRATRLNRSAAKAEDNPVPSIDLHNDGENLSAEEVAVLTASWKKARETSGIGYSSKGLTVKALGQHPEQLMIDGRKAINLELARHMGAPEWAVGLAVEGSSLTYTNPQSRNGDLINLFLKPYMTAITDRLTLDDVTPHGQKVRFDSSDLVREDTATRYANHGTAIELGLYDIEHAKELEGLDPIGENSNDQT